MIKNKKKSFSSQKAELLRKKTNKSQTKRQIKSVARKAELCRRGKGLPCHTQPEKIFEIKSFSAETRFSDKQRCGVVISSVLPSNYPSTKSFTVKVDFLTVLLCMCDSFGPQHGFLSPSCLISIDFGLVEANSWMLPFHLSADINILQFQREPLHLSVHRLL